MHEIKHDGYRLIARRGDDRVRLYTRRGFNWVDRYPRIIEALHSLPVRSIVIDGEAVVCGKDGKSPARDLRPIASAVFMCGVFCPSDSHHVRRHLENPLNFRPEICGETASQNTPDTHVQSLRR